MLESVTDPQRITEMPQSPYVEIALGLLSPASRAWEQPSRCREIIERLRADGEADLADQLVQATRKPESWLGSSAAT